MLCKKEREISMKKILLVVSLISVLLLAGCSKNEVNNDVNNVPDVVVDNGEQEEVNISDNLTEYNLLDSYVLENTSCESVYIYNLDENKQYTFNSDNTEYTISVKDDGNVYLNDEIIDIEGDFEGVIDLNTNDNFKEIVTSISGSLRDNYWIYRIKTSNEVELIREFENLSHLDKIVTMQHYGTPTRLLDLTSNSLNALYFACERNNASSDDGSAKRSGVKQLVLSGAK